MGNGASASSGSRVPTETEGVGNAMVERDLTPRDCREQGKPEGPCVDGPQESCVEDWREDWIALHYRSRA